MNLFANNKSSSKDNINLFANNSNISRPVLPHNQNNTNQNIPQTNGTNLPNRNISQAIEENKSGPQENVNIQIKRTVINQQNKHDETIKARKNMHIWFKQLQLRLLKAKTINQTPLTQIHLKTALSQGLHFFDETQSDKETYKNSYLNKQNFGWGEEVLGQLFRAPCLSQKKYVNEFFKQIVSDISDFIEIKQTLIIQYLEKCLTKEKTYETYLFSKQFNQGRQFWLANFNEHSLHRASDLYARLCIQIIKIYQLECTSLLAILYLLMTGKEKTRHRYFQDIIKKNDGQIITFLWKKLQKLIKNNLNEDKIKKRKQFCQNFRNFDLKASVSSFEDKLGNQLANILSDIIQKYCFWSKQPKINRLIDVTDAIVFFDKQYTQVTLNGIHRIEKEDYYLRSGLRLLISLIPFYFLEKEGKNKKGYDKRLVEDLRKSILATESSIVSPLRLLFEIIKGHEKNGRLSQDIKNWAIIPKQIQWSMIEQLNWTEWLAIFLEYSNIKNIEQNEDIFDKIVKMCKNVIKKNLNDFWSSNLTYQFKIIRVFIENYIREKGLRQLLPALTKSLGKTLKQTIFTLQLVGYEVIKRDIRDVIFQNLASSYKHNSHLGVSRLYSKNHLQRSITQESFVSSRGIDRYPEQELKFFCNMITNSMQELYLIESQLFQCNIHQSTGIIICNLLFQWLYKLKEYNISSLKCIRYITCCISSLFTNQSTRNCLLTGLSLSQFRNQSKKSLEQIISFSCMKQSFSEQYRQSQKLHLVFSKHLHNMVLLSSHISYYFPVECASTTEAAYMHAENYLVSSNYAMLKSWFENNQFDSKYMSNYWFASLLLILQSQKINPIDFQTIRLLLLKLKMYNQQWQREAQSLKFIQKVFNKANFFQRIIESLEPIISKNKSKAPYNMQNFRLYNSVEQVSQVRVRAKIDESLFKAQKKKKKARQKFNENIISNISGSLELLSQILNISNEEVNHSLVNGLQFYNKVIKGLSESSEIYHFKIKLDSQRQKKNRLSVSFIQNFDVNQFEVNILQVIANYINFEKNHGIHRIVHQNKQKDFDISIQVTEDILDESVRSSIITSILKSDLIYNIAGTGQDRLISIPQDFSIGISSVLKIFSRLLLKGKGTLLYNCLINHDCNIIQQISEQSLFGCKDEFHQFFRQLVDCTAHLKEPNKLSIVYEFLAISIHSSAFFAEQIILNCLKKLGSVTRKIISGIIDNSQICLLNKIALFIHATVSFRYMYHEQVDTFIKYPDNLIVQLLRKLFVLAPNSLISFETKQTNYLTSSIKKHFNLSLLIFYKGTFGICLELAKVYLLDESPELIEIIFSLVLKMSPRVLENGKPISKQLIQNMGLKPRHHIGIQDNLQITTISLTPSTIKLFEHNNSITPFLPFFQFSNSYYGRNFQYEITETIKKLVLHSDYEKVFQSLLLKIYDINMELSLEYCHQTVTSGLLTFISMALNVGDFGYLLQNSIEDSQFDHIFKNNNHIPLLYFQNTVHQYLGYFKHKNSQKNKFIPICGRNDDEIVTNLMQISRILIDFIQSNNDWQQNNDLVLIVESQIVKKIGALFMKDYIFSRSQYYQFSRLISYLLNSTRKQYKVSHKVFLIFLEGCTMALQSHQLVFNYEQALNICLLVQNLMFPEIQTMGTSLSKNQKLNQKKHCREQNSFLAANILSEILSPSYFIIDENNIHRKQTTQLIFYLCSNMVCKHLINIKTLQLNFMGIVNLSNAVIIKGFQSKDKQKQFMVELVRGFFLTYAKYFIGLKQSIQSNKKLQYHSLSGNQIYHEEDSYLNIYIAASFQQIHDSCSLYDINSLSTVFQFANSIISTEPIDNSLLQEKEVSFSIDRTEKKRRKNNQNINGKTARLSTLLNGNTNMLFGLVQIIQLKEYLNFMHSISVNSQYWTHRSYSKIVESTFIELINQKIFQNILSQESRSKRYRYQVNARNNTENLLQKIQVSKIQKYSDFVHKQKQDLKFVNMLEFSFHLQVLGTLHYYIQTMTQCLINSVQFRIFSTRVLERHDLQMNEAIWGKVTNTVLQIMDYISYYYIQWISYAPESLTKCLILYRILTKNTDFAYEIDFLNIFFYELPQSARKGEISCLEVAIISISISLMEFIRNFIEIWQKNDWKETSSWQIERVKLMKKVLGWEKSLKKNMYSQIANMNVEHLFDQNEKWLNSLIVASQHIY